MRISLVLYVYPGIEKYLEILIDSINNQTFKDFDVIIFNDNLEDVNQLFRNLQMHSTVIEVEGSINEIRFNSLKDIDTYGSEYIIFQDADDFLAENRIEANLKALEDYDLVVNDLTLVDTKSQVTEKSIWACRLGNRLVFNESFLKDKNIVGLGNTAIKKSLLNDSRLRYSKSPLAFDWFLFYQIFDLNKLNAVFISNTSTYYRQHQENIAGIKKLDHNRLKHVLDVKIAHYTALISIGFDFEKELDSLRSINIEILDFAEIKSFKEDFNFLWWEESNIINK